MKKYIPLLLGVFWIFALRAQSPVRGRVVAADSGKPLYGATIVAGNVHVTADSAGSFLLSLPGKETDIEISYTGYAVSKRHVTLPYNGFITVKLVPLARQMKEVNVSTGYQTVAR